MKLIIILLSAVLLMSCKNEVPSAPLEPPPVKSKPKAPTPPKPKIPVTQFETGYFEINTIA